ncbi:phosphotransferase enzyme family protein [Colletotrichum plurivorum]|uniref:Cytoplasmic tRNA 2-thiolation protein 2 n=1 Tax=Colletotrichum plurivorum TaxID=2175906 RepID=A0A8H6KQV9_9PEZI|nr:phosphotransferase enzyme family protein [Colletotrichum plurivorum]
MTADDLSEPVLQQVESHLANTPYHFDSARVLTGGTANFVFHAHLVQPLPDGTREVAIKHGESFVRQSPGFKLSTSRCRVEQLCLRHLEELAPHTESKLSVRTPRLFYFNEETNTQVQEYQPSPLSLKVYALQNFTSPNCESTRAQCLEIGQGIGKWLRTFHDWSNAPSQSGLRQVAAGNKEMQSLKHWANYQRLPAAIQRHPSVFQGCEEVFSAIVDQTAKELKDDADLRVIHGDFWTGNILLQGQVRGSEQAQLFVVDWEMFQLSLTSLDLGQMIAELYQFKLYKSMDAGLWLIQSFMRGYGAVSDEFAFRVLLHAGAHLVGFGTTVPGWGAPEQVSRTCYEQHIAQRVVKALAKPYKEAKDRLANTGASRASYLCGLSFGHSSAAMAHVLDQNLQGLHEKKLRVAYEVHAVHIDTDLSDGADSSSSSPAAQLLERYKKRLPNISMECVPLSDALKLDTIDWSALPEMHMDLKPAQRLKAMLKALPSVTSRVDILRLLVRHLLFSLTLQQGRHALLLGCTTTALAELTLAETAKGRGFAVPWQVGDGPVPVTTFSRHGEQTSQGQTAVGIKKTTVPVYHLLRDVFKREVVTYTGLVKPSIRELIEDAGSGSTTIVSHKELSIEDVMARYFEEVEESYPSVVANVVRTSGKLKRVKNGEACAVCGMDLDEQGDTRWKGEIGEDPSDTKRKETTSRLCYGCERSIYG